MSSIRNWEQRCEDEFDDDAIITSRDIMDKMQDEIDELRAELDMSTQSTHPENVSKNEGKVYMSQAEQNRLRSEYLTNKHKTDWSAS